MDLYTFRKRFAKKLEELVFDDGRPDISSLNPKDKDYGNELVNQLPNSTIVYTYSDNGEGIKAVGYITDIISENLESDNELTIEARYWIKYGQMTVQKADSTAGWRRHIKNNGIDFRISVKFADNEGAVSLYCKAYHEGECGDMIIHVKDEDFRIENDNNSSWSDNVYEMMSEDKGISKMMKLFITGVFEKITGSTQEVIEDLWNEE